ncbi:DUF3375 family protein [Micrococcales bacterium 31B]|nr:DUF3375 family protein [Micrococcales bacterium 31B]
MNPASDALVEALESSPALALLRAHSRTWIVPLFMEHLEDSDESVSAEWFHERVTAARAAAVGEVAQEAADLCRDWIDKKWLSTETRGGRLRYRLSHHSLRALSLVRETLAGESAVSGARLESITHAVHLLADMVNPDRAAQVQRIDAEIAALQQRRAAIASGEASLATVDEMRQQVREILAMTRGLPADFRSLKAKVDDSHQGIARRVMADGPPKAELVEDYLRQHDYLAQSSEGRAFAAFSRLLTSGQAERIRADVDLIVRQEFARTHMTAAECEDLDTMIETLLRAELEVEQSRTRWSASLRRFLTRSAHERHRHLLRRAELALHTGSEWVQREPQQRYLQGDVLGVGSLNISDISQVQFWHDTGDTSVVFEATEHATELSDADRAALRLATGTSPRALAQTVNDLLVDRAEVTGAEVLEHTDPEFRRLGALVSILDLAVRFGAIDAEHLDSVELAPEADLPLTATLPRVRFTETIQLKG